MSIVICNHTRRAALLLGCFACCFPLAARGQETPKAENLTQGAPEKAAAATKMQEELFAKFTKLMTGAKMNGQFTVDGKPLGDQQGESYEIQKVEKQPEGDLWLITARIQYGKRDFTIPVPIEVKWAGSTPVLTLDELMLPGFGTFSARVLFHKDKYAGTWSHDEVGGHMFGKIEIKLE